MRKEQIIEKLKALKIPVMELRNQLDTIPAPYNKHEERMEGLAYLDVCINFNRYVNEEIDRQERK